MKYFGAVMVICRFKSLRIKYLFIHICMKSYLSCVTPRLTFSGGVEILKAGVTKYNTMTFAKYSMRGIAKSI